LLQLYDLEKRSSQTGQSSNPFYREKDRALTSLSHAALSQMAMASPKVAADLWIAARASIEF
jgi:hypothetical protein